MIDAVTVLSILLVISSVVMVAIAWHHDKLLDERTRLQEQLDYVEECYWLLYDQHYDPQHPMHPLLYQPKTQLHG